MSNTLIEKFGTWEGVCKYYTEKSKLGEDFYNWMMLQKDYSQSQYTKGIFFDYNMYRHCYQIWKKINTTNQHHVSVWTGKVGKGKSTGAAQMASLTCPHFKMSDVCYIPSQFFKRVADSKKGDVVIIDEGGRFFGSKMHMTKLSRHLQEAFDIIRGLGLHIIICFPKYHRLDQTIRDELVDSVILKKLNTAAKNDYEKFRYYKAFNSSAMSTINQQINKLHITLFQVKVQPNQYWDGKHSAEMPTINDFNEASYIENKQKYSRKRFQQLSDEWAEDDINEAATDSVYKQQPMRIETPIDVPKEEQTIRFINVNVVAKQTTMCRETIVNWLKEGKLLGKKIGNKWVVREDSYKQMIS